MSTILDEQSLQTVYEFYSDQESTADRLYTLASMIVDNRQFMWGQRIFRSLPLNEKEDLLKELGFIIGLESGDAPRIRKLYPYLKEELTENELLSLRKVWTVLEDQVYQKV